MAFKNHELTWQFDVNQECAGSDAATHNQIMMFNLKSSLIGFSSNPWIVKGSSDSVTAGMDGVDRWITQSNIVDDVGVGQPMSWIVLEQSGLGTNFQLLIAFATGGSGNSVLVVTVSRGGLFTGGTTTAVPTAADSQSIRAGSTWGGISSADITDGTALHVMQTEDGYCTRITATRNLTPGVPLMYWAFERAKNPIEGWTHPYFCTAGGLTNPSTSFGYGQYLNFTNSSGESQPSLFRTWQDSTVVQLYFTTEGISSNFLVNYLQCKNDISGEYDLFPCGLYAPSHSVRGRYGEVYDFYLGPVNSDLYYFSDANGNARQWVQLGNMVLPWDGSFITLG